MRRIGRRDVVAAVLIALVSGIFFSAFHLEALRGLSLDILTALRFELFGDRRDPASSPVVVLAIDQESYRTPPFEGSPTLTWTREIGRVVSALIDGGARVIGFDVIFPTSIEQSEIPFGDQPLGARLRGFDRDFLVALARAATAGRLVLGEIQNRDQPERPSAGQMIAVRRQTNMRPLNVSTDADEVIRRLPLTFAIDGQPVPSMAVELASRALEAKLEQAPDGTVRLAGYAIPTPAPNTLTLNFRGGGKDIPAFSFADLRACLDKGDGGEFFRRHFTGKVVILGTVLNYEDRKLTSMRFLSGLEGARAPRCATPARAAAGQTIRSTTAGVFVHATAVRNLMERDAVTELGHAPSMILAIAFAFLTAFAACVLAPAAAAIVCVALIAVYTAGAAALFMHALALPVAEPALAGLAGTAMMIGYRYAIANRGERFLRKSFALYLAPQVIETMIKSAKMPALGGEMRKVTVLFSDLAGFSSIAEKMMPAELVALMNEYLSAMTDIIENHGGYIDKYIGDSIVAVFGAPADDPDHACNAVRAALKCRDRLEELNRNNVAFQGYELAHRIGLNSGEALVGNIGSRRRFNYTVMSDAVNVASRLEGANKYFATSIMASEMTVALTQANFVWRELDAIRVKGRADPVKVYEALAEAGHETPGQQRIAAAYAEGLACWRARRFGQAAECFDRLADVDPPSALFRARARELADHPPPPDWVPVNTLEGK
jgi:adenylate cyclase